MNRSYKVMIFDNNTASYDRLRKLAVWRENGFEIAGRISDIKELKELCAKRAVELVVCFNRPPLISAEQVITAVTSVSKGIACIGVSAYSDGTGAYSDYEIMRKCFILGAIDHLTEPVSENRLKDALERAADKIGESFVSSEYQEALDEYLADFVCPDMKFTERLHSMLAACENITVTTEYAADHFGFNKDYFGRMFKQKTGQTFGDFYKGFRIRYAEKLLTSGRYKVYEVSSMLGFSSVDYFTSVFKRMTGKTPSQLKR